MAVNRLWYPDQMLTRSRASPPNFQYQPSSVEACMQWRDPGEERSTVVRKTTTTEMRTMTESMEQCDAQKHPQHQQQHPLQQQQEARRNVITQYDTRCAPYESRHAVNRSALRNTSRSPQRRRWVEVREDDQGRPVDLTVFRPVTPQKTASLLPHRTVAEASSRRLVEVRGDEEEQDTCPPDLPVAVEPVTPQLESTIPTSAFNDSRRWVEVHEDEQGRAVDLTVVRPASPQTSTFGRSSLRGQRVEFAPEPAGYQTTYHPSSRPTSAWSRAQSGRARYDQVTEREVEAAAAADEDAAKQALMAIYQAGKPDMMFHTRAPSSATLERMLRAVSDAKVRDQATATSALSTFDSSRQVVAGRGGRKAAETGGRRYPGRDVSDDDKPVKVKVECPASSDTVVSFRVQSRAA